MPCVGYGPRGVRLGYGGGFYDRTLAACDPRPTTVGLGYTHGYVPWLVAEPHDVPLDAVLTDDGVVWCSAADVRRYAEPQPAADLERQRRLVHV